MIPKVSWLMTAYHCEKTIHQSIDSMLNQTYQDFEVIIVLEPNDYATEAICRKFAEKDSRIHVLVNKERKGVAGSLNVGLDQCRGEYIARMDADDYSYPNRLMHQVNYLDNHPEVGLLASNARIIKGGKDMGPRYRSIPSSEEICTLLLFENCLIHSTIMIRKNAYEWRYPAEFAEDYALYTSVMSQVKIDIIPEVLLDYIETGENLCVTRFEESRDSGYAISKRIVEKTFKIHTKYMDNSHFGWRYFDHPSEDMFLFLKDNLALLQEIYAINQKKKIYLDEILLKTLNMEWELTKWIERPINECGKLCKGINELSLADIDDVEFLLDLFTLPKKRIIIYGIGHDCQSLVSLLKKYGNAEIIAFCVSEKKNDMFDGIRVITPNQIEDYDYDKICIASRKYRNDILYLLEEVYAYKRQQICIADDMVSLNTIQWYKRYQWRRGYYSMLPQGRRVWLICAPDYGNIGDHAIAEATRKFFSNRFGITVIESPCAEYRYFSHYINRLISSEDILVVSGGGFLGSLWIDTDRIARDIVKQHSSNALCILPQTMFWTKEEYYYREYEEEKQIINNCRGNKVICARDIVSHSIMQSMFENTNILCMPDMVLSCEWEYERINNRNGAILCLKEDKESTLDEEDKKFLYEHVNELMENVSYESTCVEGYFIPTERSNMICDILTKFAQCKVVITDRLHGMLFSVVTGTPCVVLNNCNHKVRATYKWVSHIENVQMIENIENIDDALITVLRKGEMQYNVNDWKAYFDELEERCKYL